MAKLPLPDAPKLRVFRAVERILRNDPALGRVFGKNWKTWTGHIDDAAALTAPPAIRLTPMSGSQDWYSPDSQEGDLIIAVEVLLSELRADDVLNLWFAIERAIYPVDDAAKLANVNRIRDAGATTGYVEFSVPASLSDARTSDAGVQHFLGQMKVQIWELLNN